MAPLMSFFERIKAAIERQDKGEIDQTKAADTPAQASVIVLKSKISIGRFKRHSKEPNLNSNRHSMSDIIGLVQRADKKASRLGEAKNPLDHHEQEPGGPTEAESKAGVQRPRQSSSAKRVRLRHSSRPSINFHKDYARPSYFDSHWGLDESENMQFVTAEKSARLCRNARRRSERAEIVDPFMKAPHDHEGNLLAASSFFALAVDEKLFQPSLSRSQSLNSTR